MARWRDTKQGKITTKDKNFAKKNSSLQLPFASNIEKLKAFLTDSFMILMPIMYIVIYLGFGNLQNVAEHRAETWGYILSILGIIVVAFYVIKGQTPGLKAYSLKVIDIQTKKKPKVLIEKNK